MRGEHSAVCSHCRGVLLPLLLRRLTRPANDATSERALIRTRLPPDRVPLRPINALRRPVQLHRVYARFNRNAKYKKEKKKRQITSLRTMVYFFKKKKTLLLSCFFEAAADLRSKPNAFRLNHGKIIFETIIIIYTAYYY